MKKTVITIVGPTAVGKTSLGIFLAKQLGGEVISGDSMQVYRGMDIGTAKVRPDEMDGIPHHLIDIKEPDEEYTAARFKKDVANKIEEITGRGHLPIIVGGSGLYIQAALFDYNFPDIPRDDDLTQKLIEEARTEGIDRIYRNLQKVDPEQANKIHPNNHRRVVRALEIYITTGKTKTAWESEQTMDSPYHNVFIGLEMERQLLYAQINRRVDEMMANGLLEEVKTLIESGYGQTASMKAIGYKEFLPYFEGKQPLEEVVKQLKQNSRRYAKRQYTWFRNQLPVEWYSVTPTEKDKKFTMIFENIAGLLELK